MVKKNIPTNTLRQKIGCGVIMFTLMVFLNGCKKESTSPGILGKERIKKKEVHKIGELDFLIKNKTGETKYVTCFYYTKKETGYRWRWYKSPVYELTHGQTALVDIDTIPESRHKKDIYGYLAVFDDHTQADTAIYELLAEANRIDLGQLVDLHKKKVIIEEREYGFYTDVLDYEVTKAPSDISAAISELDFYVENHTGKNFWLTSFIFQKSSKYHPQWEYIKTPVEYFKAGSTAFIDVDTIVEKYDRKNVRGYLALFNEDEKDKAEDITYELIPIGKKLKIGKLHRLKNKKIVIREKRYGLYVDRKHQPQKAFLEFSIQPRSY